MKKLILIAALCVIAIPALADDDKRSYMGVELAGVHHGEQGERADEIYVSRVLPGTPAEAAGLQAQDRIVALDATTVATVDELHQALESSDPGDTVTVTVQRDRQEVTLDLTLGVHPVDHDGRWGVVVERQGAFLGVHIDALNSQLAEYFEVDGGVLVTEVVEESPAALAGLKAGDILVELEDHVLENPATLSNVMAHVEPGDQVHVRVQRRGQPMSFFVEAGDPQEQTITIHLQELHEKAQHITSDGNVEVFIPHVEVKGDVELEVQEED